MAPSADVSTDEQAKQQECKAVGKPEAMPTPSRRMQSPGPLTRRRSDPSRDAAVATPQAVRRIAGERESTHKVSLPRSKGQAPLLARSAKCLVGMIFVACVLGGAICAFCSDSGAMRPLFTALGAQTPFDLVKPRSVRVRTIALGSARGRAVALEVLLGGFYEFPEASSVLEPFVENLKAAGGASDNVAQVIGALSAAFNSSHTWPAALIDRMAQETLRADASELDADHQPVRLMVNEEASSAGIVVNKMWKRVLEFGAMTGVPAWVQRAEKFRRRAVSLLVSPHEIGLKDCFAFEGSGFITLVAAQGAGTIESIEIEQAPRWSSAFVTFSPRHFSVFGEPSYASEHSPAGESFEYRLAAPARQVFRLQRPLDASSPIRLEFLANGWGGNYTCISRVRAHGLVA